MVLDVDPPPMLVDDLLALEGGEAPRRVADHDGPAARSAANARVAAWQDADTVMKVTGYTPLEDDRLADSVLLSEDLGRRRRTEDDG